MPNLLEKILLIILGIVGGSLLVEILSFIKQKNIILYQK